VKRLAWCLAVVSFAGTAQAACPSYTLSSTANSYNCGVEAVNGTNPTVSEWQQIFDLIAKGPTVWGNQGPSISDIKQGCDLPSPVVDVPPLFACELLKAIAQRESAWTQFCVPTSPADQVGGPSRTIISFDCGYGVGQVTSGMHKGETPAFDQKRVAAEAVYNMASGAQIFAAKWRATKCVGDRQPTVIEHWYTATWAYNGLAYSNNPSNPTYGSSRGVWNPQVGGASPYQEKVFGNVEYPAGSPPRWESVALAYPDPADVGGSGSPPALPEPKCASPTDCGNVRPTHQSNCFGGTTDPDAGASGAGGAAPDAGAGGSAGSAGNAGSTASGGNGTSGGGGKQATRRLGQDDGGCGCKLTPAGRAGAERTERAPALLPLLALFLTFVMRRRRRAAPRGLA
jgi:MYXO-CTERM domain-containing protein